MVVQETAISTGKGAAKATSAASGRAFARVAAFVVAGTLAAAPAEAQIVGATNVPGSLRSTLLVAPNGVPLINIQTPSAAGVSRNVYNQFNVGPNGAIFNNSRTNVQTQLGGIVQGNPFLARGPARIILTEVNGGNASQLRGYMEVAGQRAEIVIANPAGIHVDGAGFINANRATLTTGAPQFNASGSLESFLVRGGTVTVQGAGLDLGATDYAAILARAVQANAGIWANELKVVTGANQVSADHRQVGATTASGAAPVFALDVAALGGMYANKIVLVGTEAGLGVRNAGTIQAAPGTPALAGAGELVVTSAGRLENTGTIQATADAKLTVSSLANGGLIGSGGNLKIAAQDALANAFNGMSGTLEGPRIELASMAGNIDNRGGTIRQTGGAALEISAPTLSNAAGGVIGPEPAAPTPTQPGASTGSDAGAGAPAAAAGPASETPPAGGGAGTGTGTEAGGTIAPLPYVPPSPGTITAAGAILNDGGRIHAGGPVTLRSANIDNNGGTLSLASMTVNQAIFDNRGGTLNIDGGFDAHVDRFDNTAGKLHAGSLNIAAGGDLINIDGTLASAADAGLTVGGGIDNTRGSISAAGALNATAAGAIDNGGGTLAANQAMTLDAGSVDNTGGSIRSAQAGARLAVREQLLNGQGGTVDAAAGLDIRAGSLINGGSLRGASDVGIAVGDALRNDGSITAGRNLAITAGTVQGSGAGVLAAGIAQDGSLASAGDLRVTVSGMLAANGRNIAAGDAAFEGASVDLSGSQTSAANIAISAMQGDAITRKATVVTAGTLRVSADGNAAQTLVNEGGALSAGQLELQLANLANTGGGEIVQTGTGATTMAMRGTLDNDGGRIASNGQDLVLQAAHIGNATGTIAHAGAGTLSIRGGDFDGAGGKIATDGALLVAMTGAFNQDTGATSAKQVAIVAGSLSNRGGQIVQAGADATRITVAGAVDNSAGTIAGNGPMTIAAASLANRGGTIQAAEASNLDLNIGGLLDNGNKGVIGAGGNATVRAASLNNDDGGSVTAIGDLDVIVEGAATNVGGMLAANGKTALVAGTLDNRKGSIAAVEGDLTVTTAGTTVNDEGTLQAGAKTTLRNKGLSNVGGKVFGDSLSVDTQRHALNNARGTLAATGPLALNSGALANDAGLIQSGGAMTIDTHGGALTNTNAAGHGTAQGGITSADTLDLKAGTVDNAAGFIGATKALTASTQAFSNTGAGTVLGQSTVSIDTHGNAYDNRAGRTLAVGDLDIRAGSIANTGGLIRSAATTALDAGSIANDATQGKDQGIEGDNVAISTGSLDNTSGAVRAQADLTIVSGGTVKNVDGLLSARNELALLDPQRANPGAKTLNLVNTGGTLVADKRLKIDAATFGADGRMIAGGDLDIALVQDIVHDGELSVSGSLRYATTGNFTNKGKLLAGQTLMVGGNDIDNAAGAEMSGADTVVNAGGTLTNRGLIDGKGATQIDAGTLNNIGTGRIYGDAVSIAAGTLNNDAETAGGETRAGTIASRGDLDIGAGTINNREHALIFSAGDMYIGGALDANRLATGKGGTLSNESARIEALGSMSVVMGTIDNIDTHVKLGPKQTTSETVDTVGVEGIGRLSPDQVKYQPGQPDVLVRNPDGSWRPANGHIWGTWATTTTTSTDTAIDADPATIVAGGDMTLDSARGVNRDSRITAGGTLTAANIANKALQGVQTKETRSVVMWRAVHREPDVVEPAVSSTKDVGAFEKVGNLKATQGHDTGKAPVAVSSGTANAGGVGSVDAGTGAATIVEVPANVGAVERVPGKNTDGAGAIGALQGESALPTGATRTIPMVVRTSSPNIGIPQASLFNVRPEAGSSYLVETDPRFANYRNWLGSDYLLNNLGLDPNNTLKRLGDGFYEQKLIREQITQLTGYRYLDGYSNDEEQYAALMNAGATFAKEYGLRPGVALSAEQMAQLTSDIVWLVEQTVTLPDGSTQRALVPQVYVRVKPGDIDGSGALLSADRVKIEGEGDLLNTGTIAGRSLVKIDKDNIDNLGGRISGGEVELIAKADINNLGGVIDARDKLALQAGRDINVRSTTQTDGLNTNLDRIAGLYVTNPGGTLLANADRDVNLSGAIVANREAGGYTSIAAKNDLNLGTVTTSATTVAQGPKSNWRSTTTEELGTTIVTNGTTLLKGDRDVNARQATVDAGEGLLSVRADRDINIASGQATTSGDYSRQWKKKSLFGRTDYKLSGSFESSTSVGSVFSGGTVFMNAKQDFTMEGSSISGKEGVAVIAGRNLVVVEGRDTASTSVEVERKKKGVSAFGAAIGLLAPSASATGKGTGIRTDMAAPSTITSSRGGILLQGNNGVVLQGVEVEAAKDVSIRGGNVVIQAATNSQRGSQSSRTKKSAYDFDSTLLLDVGKGLKARETTSTDSDTTTLARTSIKGANVDIHADDTLALAGTTITAPGTVSLTADTLVMGAQTTEQTVQTRSQGRDLVYQVMRDQGSTHQTTNYDQINAGNLAITAKHLQAGLGAQDSIEQLAKQPGMGWMEQLANDPKFKDKVDWQRVEETHKNWKHDQQGLTPEGAAIVTLVASYLSWGWAQGLGEAAGEAAAVSAGQGIVVEGATFAAGSAVGTVVSGAVAAGVTALTSQVAVALINNQGDIGRALHELGSSANVKNLLTAILTGGVLAGLDLNPAGLPTTGGGSQPLFTQLGQNLTASAARALIDTAINGGSLENNLKNGLKNAIFDTLAAQTAYEIGNLPRDDVLDDFTNKVAHAIAGCMAGALKADNAAGCGAGALGAAVGEMAAEAYGKRADTTQFAGLISGLAVALAGGDAAQINLGSQAGGNAAANNFLAHEENQARKEAIVACNNGNKAACDIRDAWNAKDKARNEKLRAACYADPAGQLCSGWISFTKAAEATYRSTPDSAALRDEVTFGVYSDAAERTEVQRLINNTPHTSPMGPTGQAVFKSLADITLDLLPVVGDIKGFVEAETPFDYTIAALGTLGPLGDAAKALIKEAKVLMAAGDAAGAATKVAEAQGATNRALHESYKDSLRAIADKPIVSDKRLSELIDKLYRPNASVGNGSTAAAVRQELATGQPVGGVFHTQKAKDSIAALQRWLDRNPTASTNDRIAAQEVIRDMTNALNGK